MGEYAGNCEQISWFRAIHTERDNTIIDHDQKSLPLKSPEGRRRNKFAWAPIAVSPISINTELAVNIHCQVTELAGIRNGRDTHAKRIFCTNFRGR